MHKSHRRRKAPRPEENAPRQPLPQRPTPISIRVKRRRGQAAQTTLDDLLESVQTMTEGKFVVPSAAEGPPVLEFESDTDGEACNPPPATYETQFVRQGMSEIRALFAEGPAPALSRPLKLDPDLSVSEFCFGVLLQVHKKRVRR